MNEEQSTWTCPLHATAYNGWPSTGCPACQTEAQASERAWRQAHSRYSWWLNGSGVLERYAAAAPELIQPAGRSAKVLREAVHAYLRDLDGALQDGRGLVLLGPPGVGKTLAAVAIVNCACRLWRGPIYCTWPDVAARVKAAFSSRDHADRQLIDRLIAAPLLAIDELAVKQQASDWEHAELFRLIDARYADCRPTVACSNASPATWPAAVGERIADRLRECGPVIALSGDSQRGRLRCEGPAALTRPPTTLTTRIHQRGEWRDQTLRIEEHL